VTSGYWLLNNGYCMRVIAFNKPYGIVSQFTSREGKRTCEIQKAAQIARPFCTLDRDGY